MLKNILKEEELALLKKIHRQTKVKREADKIKSVYLLGLGWENKKVSQALLLDEDTIASYFKKYKAGGLSELLNDNYSGGSSYLSGKEICELDSHLENSLLRNTNEVISHVKEKYGVSYGNRGMANFLKSKGYVYKKTKTIPGKADADLQQKFIEEYEELFDNKGNNPVYFLDATHPQHNVQNGYCWVKKGFDFIFPSNSGRRRLNINGALNIETKEVVSLFEERIDGEAVIRLFDKLEKENKEATSIYVICDNASYYRSKVVKNYINNKSRIKMIFLPPYSPNLNIIERLWKFFKKEVVSYYHEDFDCFKQECIDFFENIGAHKHKLDTLLTDNFQMF